MKKLTTLLVMLAATTVFAAEATSTATTADTTTPKGTCEALVAAAQKNNFEAFTTLSMPSMMGKGMGHEKMAAGHPKAANFEKMHKDQLEKLKTLTCGTEHVADTRAFVETESAGKTRYVPFVKDGSTWKFDTHTYMSFYEAGAMMGKHNKK
jgi:hypothetical protein